MDKDDWITVAWVAVAVAVTAVFLWAWPARAQEHGTAACQPPAVMAELLKNRYDEAEVGWGVDTAGKRLVQLFASPGGATWSIVVTWAGQDPCLVAGGAQWDEMPSTPGEQS